MKQGEIFFVQFEPSVGFEIKKSRPGLIIQTEPYRNTVIVLPISSKRKTNDRFEFTLKKSELNRLYLDSVVILDQVKSFYKSRFIGKVGEISESDRTNILSKFNKLFEG